MNENGRRLLALGAAVGLVAVAFVVRGGGDDDGGGGSDGGGDGRRTLVCPPELEDACDAVADDFDDVRTEDALTTADALTAAQRADAVEGDVWLVPRPWVEAVSAARDLANQPAVLGEASATIARSPVVVVVQQTRAAALEAHCGDVTLGCVGDVADGPWTNAGGEQTWGSVAAGLGRPPSGTGLVTLGAAVADHLDDPGFASNDFDGGLDNWLSKLAESADNADSREPIDGMLTQGPAYLAALATVEADADSAFGRDALRIIPAEPVVTADLVAVPIVEEGNDSDAANDLAGSGDLLDALAESGWRVEDRDLADGLDPGLQLPDEPGIPRGDVLRVLLDRWLQLV